MGNHLSVKTDVSHLFEGAMPKERPEPFIVRLTVENVYEKFEPYSFDLIIHHKLSVRAVTTESATPNYIWKVPRSTARDFEVIDAFTPNQIQLAQGQIIGIVIVECMNAYVKIFWQDFEKWKTDDQVAAIFTRWGHDNSAKDVLINDLSLGHHILYMSGENGEKVDYLHEVDEGGERKEAKIFISALKGQGFSNFEKHVAEKLKEKEDDVPAAKNKKQKISE